ncbi:hypothetical protein [Ellagibacter isourolithinifaciens]
MVSESGRALLAQSGGGSLSGASAAQLTLHPPRRFDDACKAGFAAWSAR